MFKRYFNAFLKSRKLYTAIALGIMFFGGFARGADLGLPSVPNAFGEVTDPPERPAGPILGTGCIGPGQGRDGIGPLAIFFAADGTLGISWAEFQANYAPDEDRDGIPDIILMWVPRLGDPTTEKTPCDEIGGFD